jgi:hypothetical protein
MAKQASREVIESLGGFLRRSTRFSDDEIRARMKDLEEGRLPTRDSSFRPSSLPERADDATRRDGTAPRPESSATSNDPRFATLRTRYVTERAPIVYPAAALRAIDVADDVRARLARFNEYIADCIGAGELPCVDLPDVHRANSIHDERGNVFLGQNVRRLAFDHRSGKPLMRLLLTLGRRRTTCATACARRSAGSSTIIRRSSLIPTSTRSTAIMRSRRSRTFSEFDAMRSASSKRDAASSMAVS